MVGATGIDIGETRRELTCPGMRLQMRGAETTSRSRGQRRRTESRSASESSATKLLSTCRTSEVTRPSIAQTSESPTEGRARRAIKGRWGLDPKQLSSESLDVKRG